MYRWLVVCWLVVLGAIGACGAVAADAVPIPPLKARVTDLTATLTREQQAALESALAAIEREKGAQVAILLLPSVQPETIEQFGIRLGETWKIGRKGINDGVIVIVAKADRKMRIEVGYGLEGALPDAVAKRIVAETLAPRFKAGDFYGGLQDAVEMIGRIVGGEALPAPPAQTATDNFSEDDLFFLVFVVVVMAGWARKLLGLLGSLLAAGLAGWLALTTFASWLAAGLAALAAFVLSFARFSGGGSGGWHTGGGGGGFSSSDSGSDFSGGGGDFGGGGASGDW